MAEARVDHITKTVERVVTEEVTEKVYHLTLTEEEAVLLRGLVGNVSGGRSASANKHQKERREITDSIWTALVRTGVRTGPNPFEDGTVELSSDPVWRTS